ncbi:MAG: hypothetical protein F6K23_19860 [Okeania sp. SIO2C9]|uniref:hypothetical protein n=1 Tax=Okeania sp. SIO2C9 TaxID=2607791 RepID=UPI0013C0596C|nr:hypothetical protein [Okeania sp. SIO2C9]NEQ75100.1 hypothetical protein [Okeania sp. SIO2C9]
MKIDYLIPVSSNIATVVWSVGGNLEINTVTTFFEFGISSTGQNMLAEQPYPDKKI